MWLNVIFHILSCQHRKGERSLASMLSLQGRLDLLQCPNLPLAPLFRSGSCSPPSPSEVCLHVLRNHPPCLTSAPPSAPASSSNLPSPHLAPQLSGGIFFCLSYNKILQFLVFTSPHTFVQYLTTTRTQWLIAIDNNTLNTWY